MPKFEKKFVHFMWDDDLDNKNVIGADKIHHLIKMVESGESTEPVSKSTRLEYPFYLNNSYVTRFVYYDPDYEDKITDITNVAKNLAECRRQYVEMKNIFDIETSDLRYQINSYVDKIRKKFFQFKDDLLGRLDTDDYHFEMRWGVTQDDETEIDYVSISVGYKDGREFSPCSIDIPLEEVDEIKTFEDLKRYADIYFYPDFFESPSLRECNPVSVEA